MMNGFAVLLIPLVFALNADVTYDFVLEHNLQVFLRVFKVLFAIVTCL